MPPNELRAKVSVFANLHIRAQELASRAREVQTSADEFWLLTDAAPIGIFQTDAENRYLYTNPRWSEITGIPPEVAAGQPFGSLVQLHGRADLEGDAAEPDANHGELHHRLEIQAPGSTRRIVLVTSKSIPSTDGSHAGWVGTVADITAEVGAEAALSDRA